MQQLTFPLLQAMSDKMEETYRPDGISVNDYFSTAFTVGELGWREPVAFRTRFELLYAKHVQNFTRSITWSTSFKVLELGAGFLTEGRSRLSRCLPEADICYSDFGKQAAADAHEKSPATHYLHMNSSRITETLSPSSMDVVVASCFLDTLPKGELVATLQQIFDVLKPGGTLFHISDLEPWFNTLPIDNKNDPDIMFPWIDDSKFINGIQFVSKSTCRDLIQTLRAEGKTHESNFLKKYIQLPNDARAAVVIEICTMLDNALYFSNWVEKHVGETRKIQNEQFFSQRLEAALGETAFEVSNCRNQLQFNVYSKEEAAEHQLEQQTVLHGRVIEDKKVRDDGSVRMTLGAHILIAKKKEEAL